MTENKLDLHFSSDEWEYESIDSPQQENGVDCGVFTIWFIIINSGQWNQKLKSLLLHRQYDIPSKRESIHDDIKNSINMNVIEIQ
jgi:Ulp1 family protease